MSIRALSVMENLSDRFNPRVCFPLVKMFHATLKNTMQYIKMIQNNKASFVSKPCC